MNVQRQSEYAVIIIKNGMGEQVEERIKDKGSNNYTDKKIADGTLFAFPTAVHFLAAAHSSIIFPFT